MISHCVRCFGMASEWNGRIEVKFMAVASVWTSLLVVSLDEYCLPEQLPCQSDLINYVNEFGI